MIASRHAVALGAAIFAQAAWAQAVPAPPAAGGPASAAPAPAVPAPAPRTGTVKLAASFANDPRPIGSGLVWRLYADGAESGALRPAARSAAPSPSFSLPVGPYWVHVAYGFASAVKRVSVGEGGTSENVTLSAGALRIAGAIGDAPIPPAKISFSVYVPIGPNPEGRLVVANAHPGDLIRLPEGTYHAVSTYGDSNAIIRSDLKVEVGKITEATLNHRAATVTLKLVRTAGGEAFAGTAFSVLTPGGDVIREAIGAFPSFVLAEGDYVVIARHEGQVYTRDFKVLSGLDRDIEVTAK